MTNMAIIHNKYIFLEGIYKSIRLSEHMNISKIQIIASLHNHKL